MVQGPCHTVPKPIAHMFPVIKNSGRYSWQAGAIGAIATISPSHRSLLCQNLLHPAPGRNLVEVQVWFMLYPVVVRPSSLFPLSPGAGAGQLCPTPFLIEPRDPNWLPFWQSQYDEILMRRRDEVRPVSPSDPETGWLVRLLETRNYVNVLFGLSLWSSFLLSGDPTEVLREAMWQRQFTRHLTTFERRDPHSGLPVGMTASELRSLAHPDCTQLLRGLPSQAEVQIFVLLDGDLGPSELMVTRPEIMHDIVLWNDLCRGGRPISEPIIRAEDPFHGRLAAPHHETSRTLH